MDVLVSDAEVARIEEALLDGFEFEEDAWPFLSFESSGGRIVYVRRSHIILYQSVWTPEPDPEDDGWHPMLVLGVEGLPEPTDYLNIYDKDLMLVVEALDRHDSGNDFLKFRDEGGNLNVIAVRSVVFMDSVGYGTSSSPDYLTP